MPAHGDHWGAVEKEVDMFVETMVPLICKEGEVIGEHSFCHTMEDVDKKEGIAFGVQYPAPASPLSFLVLAVREVHPEGNMVWSAYPVCAEGPRTRLVVDEVKVWPNGIEGAVTAYMEEGDSICFYDPFFFLNREKYQEWAEIDVALSALAYALQKAEPEEAGSDEEAAPESPGEAGNESAPESDAGALEASPDLEEGPADYYDPCGEFGDSARMEFIVEEAVPVACVGRLFWRMTGVIMRAGDGAEMRIHVYASEQVLKGYLPQPGDDVLALAWIQGRLLSVAP